jgi:hydrogenase nickel incorporation protein HypA/HybF
MHELSICTSIASVVAQHARGRRVVSVRVTVGRLRQATAEALTLCWDAVVERTPLTGARLDVEEVPAEVECADCGVRSVLDEPYLRCPGCGSARVAVIAGEEFLVASIEIEKG